MISGRLKNLLSISENPRFKFAQVDIRDAALLEPLFGGIDWVFHFAGLADIVPSIEMPAQYYSTNVTGTFNVLECARRCGAKRVLYAASSSSYGIPGVYPTPETTPICPQYPYALTKYMGEELLLHWASVYKLPAVSLRLFNVFGTRSRTTGTYGAVFGVFLAQKLKKQPFTVVGDGTQTRDFIYIDDLVDSIIRGSKYGKGGEIFQIATGRGYTIQGLALEMKKIFNSSLQKDLKVIIIIVNLLVNFLIMV